MSAATATEERVEYGTEDGRRIINHYFYKADMTRAIVTGESILAICGHISTVSAQGGGKMTKRSRGVLVICSDCKSIYDNLEM